MQTSVMVWTEGEGDGARPGVCSCAVVKYCMVAVVPLSAHESEVLVRPRPGKRMFLVSTRQLGGRHGPGETPPVVLYGPRAGGRRDILFPKTQGGDE